MRDVALDFTAHLSTVRGLSPHTVRAYTADLNHFGNWCRRVDLGEEQLSHRDVRRYLGELDRAQYSRSTIARKMATLRAYFDYLVERGVYSDNPAQLIGTPKQEKRLPKVLSQAEVEAILDAPDTETMRGIRDSAVLESLYATGARVSELSRLDRADVDLKRGIVILFGKGRKQRIVPVYPVALQKIERYVEDARPLMTHTSENDALFLSTRGNRLSSDAIRRIVTKYARLAGIPAAISPHSFRHTIASDLLAAGADLRSVQELLGHSDLSTTQIYTHVSPTHLKKVHEQSHPRA